MKGSEGTPTVADAVVTVVFAYLVKKFRRSIVIIIKFKSAVTGHSENMSNTALTASNQQ